ncbi:uncharacterized protein [Procambarus clarkii]|uniref:uncharacterized protein n=1 Tax=Procambarus clarkii TaxID=6728 RepID=UPI0037444131
MEGLLGTQATEDLRKRSIGTGLANALIGYLAMPKNQNLGLGRILAGSAQAGIQGAQGVYGQALEDYQTRAKIEQMQLERALQAQKLREQQTMKALAPSLIRNIPAVTEQVDQGTYFIPRPTAEGAVAPEYGLQAVQKEPIERVVTPARREIDFDTLQKMMAVSSDPLATLKTSAELVPALRKAGMLQTGTTENPFTTWIETSTSPQVKKLASQYATSYANGTIDAETADKRIADLAKAEESYISRTDTAAARKLEADRQFELRQQLANNQISQAEFNRQIAEGNLALRQQLADQKNVKTLPAGALKMEGENIATAYESAQLANQVDAQIKSIISNKLDFSPAKNVALSVSSAAGSTDPEVLAYNDFQQFKTKLVNDTLRLNKGTQTEGDAVRAANELTNARSTQDVVRSLQKIRDINAQAVSMQNQIVSSRRKSGGLTEDRGYPAAEQIPVPKFEPVIFTKQQYDKLPKGAVYLDANTNTRRVKGE